MKWSELDAVASPIKIQTTIWREINHCRITFDFILIVLSKHTLELEICRSDWYPTIPNGINWAALRTYDSADVCLFWLGVCVSFYSLCVFVCVCALEHSGDASVIARLLVLTIWYEKCVWNAFCYSNKCLEFSTSFRPFLVLLIDIFTQPVLIQFEQTKKELQCN